jgi:hypothetical protein
MPNAATATAAFRRRYKGMEGRGPYTPPSSNAFCSKRQDLRARPSFRSSYTWQLFVLLRLAAVFSFISAVSGIHVRHVGGLTMPQIVARREAADAAQKANDGRPRS